MNLNDVTHSELIDVAGGFDLVARMPSPPPPRFDDFVAERPSSEPIIALQLILV